MYAPETILKRKDPKPEGDAGYPYNEVEVIGTSPVNHGIHPGSWDGAGGQGVLIRPLTEFGATADEPYGKLQDLYDVASIPERTAPRAQDIKVIDASTGEAGKSPEEIFADAARENPTTPAKKRRSAPSPITE